MSTTARKSALSSRKGERVLTPEILEFEVEKKFLKSLYDFLEHEKRYLRCPEEGPSELRYVLYRAVFNKLIAQSSAYKRILLTIKTEYDQVIRAISQTLEDSRSSQDSLKASSLQLRSIEACESRAVRLKERISVLQKENVELQQEIDRQKSWSERRMWIPGLTVAESEESELLEKHLDQLQSQRAALLEKRRQCVSVEVRAGLDTELQVRGQWRASAEADNRRLKLLYKRLGCVYECVCSWREGGQHTPLEQLLQNVTHTTVTEDDLLSVDTELLESEEPTGVDESEYLTQYLTQYLHRFVELIDSGQYKEAAEHAALSPRGLLRNIHTVNMFKAATGPPHSEPPLLLLFHSLLVSTPVGHALPEPVSYEGVCCALEQGQWQLLSHAFNFHKLTLSERLGDVLAQCAQNNSSVYHSDMLLALATVSYRACGSHRNTALSMCRRGLAHSTVDFMRHCETLTAEDYLWVFCQRPSLSLLQLLTRPERGVAMLSVGAACSALLSDAQLQEFALQLLDSFIKEGAGVLEEVILEDSGSTADEWSAIAAVCSTLRRSDLTHRILNILLSQSGTQVLTSDPEGAHLTQHLFM